MTEREALKLTLAALKQIDEQLELLKKHRWLGTDFFLPRAKQWLEEL